VRDRGFSDAASARVERQFVVLKAGARPVAIEIERVLEMLRMVALVPLDDAPEWVAGVLNLRGRVIPVVDLRARLRLHAGPIGLDSAICIVDSGERSVGLIADEAVGVAAVGSEALSAPEGIEGIEHPVKLVAQVAEGLLPVLDVDRICDGTHDLELPDLNDAA
jgi:purine-binding chemotaxis protein CheW